MPTTQLRMWLDDGYKRFSCLVVQEKCAVANLTNPNERHYCRQLRRCNLCCLIAKIWKKSAI